MERQIHWIEQEAYSSVLRAFKGQSDALTWEKECLITELRKELRVSDEEHRELLNRVNADDIIQRTREWRQRGIASLNNAHNPVPSPTVSASGKRQKTSHSIPSLSFGAPSPVPHSQPSSSAPKRAPTAGSKGKKTKFGQIPGSSSMKSMPYPSTGPSERGQVANKNSSGAIVAVEAAPFYRLIGRKVKTRWPEDNSFYDAVVADCRPAEVTCQMCAQGGHEGISCSWVYTKCKQPTCTGLCKLLVSSQEQSKGRRFLRCQYGVCKGFQWLEDAMEKRSSSIESSTNGCYGCGSLDHWVRDCQWVNSPCTRLGCKGKRKICTSKQAHSFGEKFLKCQEIGCNNFQWLKDIMTECKGHEAPSSSLRVTTDMSIDDLCVGFSRVGSGM